MLTKYDDFLCHQMVGTFDHVETSAREWTERTWFTVHDRSGKFHLVTSIACYSNRNIMDTYASLAFEGKTQYVVRASRELRPRYDETKVGPFSYEVIEGLRSIRSTLDENEHGLSYDLTFEATMNAHEEEPQFTRVNGRVEENIKRYVQVGKPSGWIKVEGTTYQVDNENWFAERDHSWGIRRGGGVPETGVQPGEIRPGGVFNFIVMQFDNWGFTYQVREDWEGKASIFSGGIFYPYGSGKEGVELTSVEHDFRFRKEIPGTRQVDSGKVVLNAADGSKMEISMNRASICYLKPGGYFGYEGFTHGLWMGSYFSDGFKLDLTDPKVVAGISFLDDAMCEMRCGNEVGYGINELIIHGKYPKYGFEGY